MIFKKEPANRQPENRNFEPSLRIRGQGQKLSLPKSASREEP